MSKEKTVWLESFSWHPLLLEACGPGYVSIILAWYVCRAKIRTQFYEFLLGYILPFGESVRQRITTGIRFSSQLDQAFSFEICF